MHTVVTSIAFGVSPIKSCPISVPCAHLHSYVMYMFPSSIDDFSCLSTVGFDVPARFDLSLYRLLRDTHHIRSFTNLISTVLINTANNPLRIWFFSFKPALSKFESSKIYRGEINSWPCKLLISGREKLKSFDCALDYGNRRYWMPHRWIWKCIYHVFPIRKSKLIFLFFSTLFLPN